MSDDLKTLVAQEVAKQLAAIAADQTTKKVLDFLKNRNSADAYVVETWSEGSEWYRVWSDGFIEQGGTVSTTTNTNITTTLNKSFTSTQYNLQLSGFGEYWVHGWGIRQKSKNLSSFIFLIDTHENATGITLVDWYACGY